jgi:hypothetical protein
MFNRILMYQDPDSKYAAYVEVLTDATFLVKLELISIDKTIAIGPLTTLEAAEIGLNSTLDKLSRQGIHMDAVTGFVDQSVVDLIIKKAG